jgi:bifunctional DNase/RNase
LGSILVVNGEQNETYISDIHVRRRETIAMTPSDSFTALKSLVTHSPVATTKAMWKQIKNQF